MQEIRGRGAAAGESSWHQVGQRGRGRQPGGRGAEARGGRSSGSSQGGRFARRESPNRGSHQDGPRQQNGPGSSEALKQRVEYSGEGLGKDFGSGYELPPAAPPAQQPSHTAPTSGMQAAAPAARQGQRSWHGSSAQGADDTPELEKQLSTIKAEIGRLAAVESDLQQKLDSRSQMQKLTIEVADMGRLVKELQDTRDSLLAKAEQEHLTFKAQMQQKDQEIDNLSRQLYSKDEAIRERDSRILEQEQRQSQADSSMDAALQEQKKIIDSKQQQLREEVAAKEGDFKARESELLTALSEWQRAAHGKEEAIWHMQALHANEKSSMEQHFLHQINVLLSEKRALSEELQRVQAGAGNGESLGKPPSAAAQHVPQRQMPGGGQQSSLPQPPAQPLAAQGGQPMAAPPIELPRGQAPASENSAQGLNWIQSLMSGNLAGSSGETSSGGHGDSNHLKASLDPKVSAPQSPNASAKMPPPPAERIAPVQRLRTQAEIAELLIEIIPEGQHAAIPWTSEEDMAFENLLAPYNWETHYDPLYGSVMDFMLSEPDVFVMNSDGTFHRLPKEGGAQVVGPKGIGASGLPQSPVGTRPNSGLLPPPAQSSSTLVVTPMPSSTAPGASQPPTKSAATAPSLGGGKKVAQSGRQRDSGGKGDNRSESRSRTRRGGSGGGGAGGAKPSSGGSSQAGGQRRPASYKAAANSSS